jgi:flagellum-specific ATP synthase
MPKLLERCANSDKGTLTGFFTVLVEGDDRDEPISDSAEGFLDGHIILSRKLSEAGHYPAVDVLQSVSRSAVRVAPEELLKTAEIIKHHMAVYRDAEDLINVGAYNRGTNKAIDLAIDKHEAIDKFLIQDLKEKASFDESMDRAMAIAGVK